MPRPSLVAVVLAGAIALTLLPSAAAGARGRRAPHPAPRVPQGFVGMNVNVPVFPPRSGVDLARQLDVMVASGVESIRVPFDWASAQPYSSWNDVPAAKRSQFVDVQGTPTRWGPFDQIVGLAAARGLTVLPTVLDAPDWDGERGPQGSMAIPVSAYYFGNFVGALAARYGSAGTFWTGAHAAHPKLPVEMWQIWNEPDLTSFWWKQPFERSYVTLLEALYPVIKAADPHAKVVLGGFPNYSWGYLDRIYRIHGARKYFDVVAIHPYTKQPQGVVTIAKKVRFAMDTHGDPHKPMMITESGWTSSQGHTRRAYDFETTQTGQAKALSQVLALLGRARTRLKLIGFYWYNWADAEQPSDGAFSYSGLFRISSGRFLAKPALAAFRQGALALERCRAKGARATVCRRRG
jgi:hypothetical protein